MFSQPLKDCVTRVAQRVREMEERLRVEQGVLDTLKRDLEESCSHENIKRSMAQRWCEDCGKDWDFSF